MSQRLINLRRLAKQIVALQEQARSLGIFAGDRELLECPKCGLLEDVTFTGQLITCRPPEEGMDTGLRFQELPRNRFRCVATELLRTHHPKFARRTDELRVRTHRNLARPRHPSGQVASNTGITHFERAPTPGCRVAFIQTLAQQVRGKLPVVAA